jgi:hypothetical protein
MLMKMLSVVALAAVTMPPLVGGAFQCEHVLARSSCFCAIASNVSKRGGGVTVGAVVFDNCNPATCPKLKEGKAITYREMNGKPGYQEPDPGATPPDPGDELVDSKCAAVSEPSNNITVGSISNGKDKKKRATHWELSATDEDGEINQFSGTF